MGNKSKLTNIEQNLGETNNCTWYNKFTRHKQVCLKIEK